MIGRELIQLLEREGFSVVRRSQTLVWLGRGEAVLLIDMAADIANDVANDILEKAQTDVPN